MNQFVGIILAGGKSRRFGSPKAIAKRNDKPFYQYSVDTLDHFCTSTIIVTNPSLYDLFQVSKASVSVINDDSSYKGEGPLAGIYTAMNMKESSWYVVLPIDVPFIEKWVIECLIGNIEDGVEAVVPIVAGKQQPLIAIYHHSIKDLIRIQLTKGNRSMNSILTNIKVKKVRIEEEKPFINVNRMSDYKEHME